MLDARKSSSRCSKVPTLLCGGSLYRRKSLKQSMSVYIWNCKVLDFRNRIVILSSKRTIYNILTTYIYIHGCMYHSYVIHVICLSNTRPTNPMMSWSIRSWQSRTKWKMSALFLSLSLLNNPPEENSNLVSNISPPHLPNLHLPKSSLYPIILSFYLNSPQPTS